jgi:serine/threonine protein kinase/formylglycine-generating enzyme required for sulfatase activity
MIEATNNDSHLRLALERDRLCDQFEAELRAGGAPLIEQYLNLVPEPAREALLSELLHLEVDWSGSLAEEQRTAYLARFPAWQATVERALALDDHPLPAPLPHSYDERSRFRILRLYAHGGLGVVYAAIDEQLGRVVALKEIQPELAHDQNLRKRFEFEARLTSRLEHPGIVPVYAASKRSGGEPYYVSKLVRGDPLKEAIQELHKKPVWARHASEQQADLRRLLRRFLVVCETVAYAHSMGVLHRDLKPGNILLGDFGETLVIDWGLAKPLPEEGGEGRKRHPEDLPPLQALDRGETTVVGSDVGTPIYSSPEQLDGGPSLLGPRSDVYSLGATLYHMVTGKPPYDPRQPLAVIRAAVVSGTAPPLRAVHRRSPRALEAICSKAMARDPSQRYESALALARDIESFLGREAVEAYPEPILNRVGRFARRHRVLSGIVLTLASVLLGLGFLSLHRQGIAASNVAATLDQIERSELEQVPFLAEPLMAHGLLAHNGIEQRLASAKNQSARDALILAWARIDAEGVSRLTEQLRSRAALRDRLATALVDARGSTTLGGDSMRQVLQSVGPELVETLRSIQSHDADAGGPRQEKAGELLLDFAKSRPEALAWGLSESTDGQFPRYVDALRETPDRAREALKRVLLDQGTLAFRQERNPVWSEPNAETLAAIERAEGFAHPDFLWWQRMPSATFDDVSKALVPTGYRPLRVRPFRATDGTLLVASIWARDGAAWVTHRDLESQAMLERDRALERRGFRPADVSCYLTPERSQAQYAGVWARPSESVVSAQQRKARSYSERVSAVSECPPGRVSVGLSVTQARSEALDRDRSGWPGFGVVNETIQLVRHPDGRQELAQLDQAALRSEQVFSFSLGTLTELREKLAHGLVQRDIGIIVGEGPQHADTYLATWKEPGLRASRTLVDLAPAEHLASARSLAVEGYLPESISIAQRKDGPTVGGSVWCRMIHDRNAMYPARQRARAAVALYQLGEPEPMWEMLRHNEDPTERSWLVELLPKLGVTRAALIEHFAAESDVSARRALLLALGGFSAAGDVADFMDSVQTIARREPDPGLHSAALWLFSQWRSPAEAQQIRASLAAGLPSRDDNRRWYLTEQGQELAIIPGPVTFTMGGPNWDMTDEGLMTAHPVRIERDFAIGMTEVTVAEMQRFQDEMERRGVLARRSAETPFSRKSQGPALGVDFFLAARYCNWLSEREGLPESEWCFLERPEGGLVLAPDYLKRTGYRLPTEAEWEHACRSGSSTPRFYGRGLQENDPLLPRYAWCILGNAHNRARSVAQLKPNDFGLFDMLGNAHEWCLDPKRSYCQGACNQVRSDVEDGEPLGPLSSRVLRGGWFHFPASGLSSSYRSWSWAAYGHNETGFRVARTLPPR